MVEIKENAMRQLLLIPKEDFTGCVEMELMLDKNMKWYGNGYI